MLARGLRGGPAAAWIGSSPGAALCVRRQRIVREGGNVNIVWLSVILFPLLVAFFGSALLASLERNWRLAAVSLISVLAALTAVLLTGPTL